MTEKTVFFDIDSTLLGTKNGRPFQIPPSALKALRLLKKNGHRAAICSGRQEAFIQHYFPGIFKSYVAMNGTHVVFEGKTVFDLAFSCDRVAELMRHFDSYGCSYVFIGKRNGWPRNIPPKIVERLNEVYGFPDFLKCEWKPDDVHANMLDFVFPDEADYEKHAGAFTGKMVLNRHPGGLTADLSFPENDKAHGIARFLEYAAIPKENTVAFGDGYNDITMMSAVGCGVAMGNAVNEVKKAAAYVTADIFDDGIYKGLKHLGLI